MTSYDGVRPDPTDSVLVERLREDLAAAGYTVEAVERVLGPMAAAALHREQSLPARRRVRQLGVGGPSAADEPAVAVLVALFGLGLPCPVTQVGAVFRRTGMDGLARLGLVVPVRGTADLVRATCDLRPYGDEEHTWWVASDLAEVAVGGPLRTDHVLGVGGASATLASWTPRPQVSRALDVGTGCGVQALHLAGHADQVVATDLSSRALAFAAFNAALAGQQWDLRQGSLWEPVAGEQYDLVVSNPPFVITPRSGDIPVFEYRDGGLAGDGIVAAMVRGAAAHLTEGGIAHLLGNWELAPGQDWREVWSGWLAGTGLDAFVVQRDSQDAAEYAETWARDGGHRPGVAAYDEMVGSWLDDFETRGVDRIGFGVITLRRPPTGVSRAPWIDLVDHSGPVANPMGPAVLARVAARDWLATHTRADVLDRCWQAAADVTDERHLRPGADGPSVILIRQGGGLGVALAVDTVLSAFVGVCDGELTAGQALGGIAALLDVPVDDVVAQAWPGVERMIAEGMLLPA